MAPHEEPCLPLTELQTTFRNGRWLLGAFSSVCAFAFMFLGWVANDNLAGIRSDMKEAKGMLQSGQIEVAKIRTDVDYLKQWKQEIEGRVVAKR